MTCTRSGKPGGEETAGTGCLHAAHTSQVGLLLLPWVYKERFHGHGVVFRELQENCSDLTYRL